MNSEDTEVFVMKDIAASLCAITDYEDGDSTSAVAAISATSDSHVEKKRVKSHSSKSKEISREGSTSLKPASRATDMFEKKTTLTKELIKNIKPRVKRTNSAESDVAGESEDDATYIRKYMSEEEEAYRDYTWKNENVLFDKNLFIDRDVMIFDEDEVFSSKIKDVSIDEFITKVAGVFTRFMKATRIRNPESVIPRNYVRECVNAMNDKDLIWDVYKRVEEVLDSQGYEYTSLDEDGFATAISQGRKVFLEQCWWIILNLQKESAKYFAKTLMRTGQSKRSNSTSMREEFSQSKTQKDVFDPELFTKKPVRRWSSTKTNSISDESSSEIEEERVNDLQAVVGDNPNPNPNVDVDVVDVDTKNHLKKVKANKVRQTNDIMIHEKSTVSENNSVNHSAKDRRNSTETYATITDGQERTLPSQRKKRRKSVVESESSECSSSTSDSSKESRSRRRESKILPRRKKSKSSRRTYVDTSSDEEYVPRGYVPLDSQAEFDGKGGEDVARSWLKMFEYNADAMGKLKKHRCSHMKLLLKGAALHWFNSLPVHVQRHWKDLRNAFDVRFCHTKTDPAELYWSAYRNDGEDAVEYFWRLNALAKRARIDYTNNPVAEKKHIMHFASTMGECVDKRRIAMMKSVDTLATFLDDMIELENREKRIRTKLGLTHRNSTEKSTSKNTGSTPRHSRQVHVIRSNAHTCSREVSSSEGSDVDHVESDVRHVCFARTEHHSCSKCGKRHRDEDCWKDVKCTACKMVGHPENKCNQRCKLCKTVHGNSECEVYTKFQKFRDLLQKKGDVEYIVDIEKILNEFARLQ